MWDSLVISIIAIILCMCRVQMAELQKVGINWIQHQPRPTHMEDITIVTRQMKD